MHPGSPRKPYDKPLVRDYGRMGTVTRKSFAKGGNKKDPGTPFRNRLG